MSTRAANLRILLCLSGLVLLMLGPGCTRYSSVAQLQDGKLLVAYEKGGFGFYSGGIYECTRKGKLELDCKELYLLLPNEPRGERPTPEITEITTDKNDLDGTATLLMGWLKRTVAVHVSDGNMLTGTLAEVRGKGAETLLVLNTERGPLAVRLSDTTRVTALQRAK